ncbi:cell division protein FtsL [Bacillus testis]|uniref:cell division protein FtsL n=1 Tax=Bacillus testis TaxID=1622072 RepID=UPI001E4421FA|nr:cell division protein FtsL [Bacillus testis]
MLARKIAADNHQHEQSQTVTTVVVHKAKVTLGEKVLVVAFALLLAVAAVKIISNQYSLYSINKDIQKAEKSVDEHVKQNTDLKIQVSELSRYERIWEKASQMGLTLDENNVKVVQK